MKKRLEQTLLLLILIVIFTFLAKIYSENQYNKLQNQMVLRFAVTSRTNVYDEDCDSFKRFTDYVYQYADNQDDYNLVDAFVINGNVTGDGSVEAFEAIEVLKKKYLRKESNLFTTMGEQDFIIGETDEVSDPEIQEKIKDYIVNIKNFNFIFLSPIYDSYSSKFEWLDNNLKSISKYNNKPIFVFQNAAIKDTYYGTGNWYNMESDGFKEILEKYPTVVDFSSSTATAANLYTSVFQNNSTYVNSGTMANMRMNLDEYGFDLSNETINENAATSSQCQIIEVYGDGHIEIKTMNLVDGSICRTPDGSTEMVRSINFENEKIFKYTQNSMIYGDLPVFDVNSFQYQKISEEQFWIKFNTPNDRDGILFYNIKIYNRDNELINEFNTYSDYINNAREKIQYINVNKIDSEMFVNITPFDIYGLSGDTFNTMLSFGK